MTDRVFIRATLRGKRFKDGELPLSVLADLASLQGMVIDVAKWRFGEANPDRRRSPRGFDQVYLKLTGLGSGSSVAKIEIGTTRSALFGVPNQECFETAAGDISDAIGLAEQNDGRLRIQIPKKYLAHFNRIGRSLQDGETLEVKAADRDPVRLTAQSRERLVLLSAATEVMRNLTLRGTVFEADQAKMAFHLKPIYGLPVRCRFTEQHRDDIIAALDGYKNVKVLVRGTGIYDRQNGLSRVEPVEHVAQLDTLDVDAQLDEFRNLQDGWLNGEGTAPNHAELDWLSEVFGRHYPDNLPLPHAYPAADGGVSLEWSLGAREVDILVNISAHKG